MKSFYLLTLTILFTAGCSGSDHIRKHEDTRTHATVHEECFNTENLSERERAYADSLLYTGINNEALHTLISPLKPMSDIATYRFAYSEADSLDMEPHQVAGTPEFREKFEKLNRVVNAIECGPLSATLIPFRQNNDSLRFINLRVHRTDAIDRVLAEYPEFWEQWGFVKGSKPETVIQVMEYENPADRFRGYGYLYGYPEHAVNFFVEAAKHYDKTEERLDRDFINLPVVSDRKGRFVYAVEEGHSLNDADVFIEESAHENVSHFKNSSEDFYNSDGSFRTIDYLRAEYQETADTQHIDANEHMHRHNFEDLVESFEDPGRKEWQKPDEVISYLGDIRELTIADIGAGTGYFTFRLVDEGARVIAADVDERFLDFIEQKKTEKGISSSYLEARRVPYDNPNLSDEEADMVFLVNTYHHIEDRENYFSYVSDGLSENGRLVVIDFFKEQEDFGPPYEMRISADQAQRELEKAGFTQFNIETELLPYQYILVAEE